MSRFAIVALLLVLIAAAVGGLYWFSRTMSGISMGGPVPLQSIAPAPWVDHPPVHPAIPLPPTPHGSASVQSPGTPPPKPVPRAAVPRIFNVSLTPPVVSGGQVVTGTVQTSTDVTAVSAQIMGYASPLTKVSVGYFALSYRVPVLPAPLRRTYTIVVTATNAAGRSASSSLPITIR